MNDTLEMLQNELEESLAMVAKLQARIESLESYHVQFETIDNGALLRAYRFSYEGKGGMVEIYEKATSMYWNGKEYIPYEAPSDLLMAACKADPIMGW